MLIAGDIGGTKTLLAVFSTEAGPHFPIVQEKFHSADYPSLEAIVKEFLTKTKKPVDSACFAVAGPVIDGRVKTTNLPWVMEEIGLAKALNLNPHSVHLINDLEAIARSVPVLRPNDVETINTGESVPNGAIAVIAPGTGLGESFLTWDDSCYVAHSSEGGHCDFAPTDERQIHLLQYMRTKFDHVSFEHVCSGIGIPHIYGYLQEFERMQESPGVDKLITAASDASVVIIDHAFGTQNPSQLCSATIDIFVSILASEAANLSLKVLATGGIYMAGGVVLNILAALQRPAFMQSFKRKGRFAELMAKMPIHVIASNSGLTGAAAAGLDGGKSF
jgi:glucokinase